MKRVEKDPEGGWIARDRHGNAFFDDNWRWNSRATARAVVWEIDGPASQPLQPKTGDQ